MKKLSLLLAILIYNGLSIIDNMVMAQSCTGYLMSNCTKMEFFFANAKHLFEVSKRDNVIKLETSLSNGAKS